MGNDKFIAINDVRIKASNIKNYGIAEETHYHAAVYKLKEKIHSAFFFFSYSEYTKEKTNRTVAIDKEQYDFIMNGNTAPIYGLFPEEGNGKGYVEISSVFDDDMFGINYTKVPEGYITYAIKRRHEDLGNVEEEIMVEATPDDIWCDSKKYLYITTYQNDNFKFYEDEVNIAQVMSNIDSCLL